MEIAVQNLAAGMHAHVMLLQHAWSALRNACMLV